MYSLNLGYYSVEQVNHQGVAFTQDAWDRNSKRALNDVVDPNTEFQAAASSVAPVSTLESYGFPESPQTPLRNTESTNTGFTQSVECDAKCTSRGSVIVEGKSSQLVTTKRAISIREKNMNSLRVSQEIPQVHGCHKPGLNPLGTPSVSNGAGLAVSKRNKCLSNTNASRGKQKPAAARDVSARGNDEDVTNWAARNARDVAASASDTSKCSSRFDLDSNFSERADTMSSFSGVSGYEEELFRIRRLLLLDPASPYEEKHLEALERNKSVQKEDARFQVLNRNAEVKAAFADSGKIGSERASPDWQPKYEHMLREMATANSRLEKVRDEVEAEKQAMTDVFFDTARGNAKTARSKLQLQHCDTKTKPPSRSFQRDPPDLEASRHQNGNSLELEAENNGLKIELQDLRLDFESQAGAIQELKVKIADQHVELQMLRQSKLGAENCRASMKNDLETARKSASWYRDRLHACQTAKVRLEQELMTVQSAALSSSHAIGRLEAEADRLRAVAEETQTRAVREKDELMSKLETIHTGMLEREAAILDQLRRENLLVEPAPVHLQSSKTNRSSNATEEADGRIAELKSKLEDSEKKLRLLGSGNANLVKKVSDMEKDINDKEMAFRDLDDRFRNLKVLHDSTIDALRGKEKSVLQIRNEKADLEVALITAARQKTEVDSAIENLRDNFTRIESHYQSMQGELLAKDNAISTRCKERWGHREFSDWQKEIISGFARVESELKNMQSNLAEVNVLENLLHDLNSKHLELSRQIRENNQPKDYACLPADQLQEMLTFQEDQLASQARSFAIAIEDIKARYQLVNNLQQDKNSLQTSIESLLGKIARYSEEEVALKNGMEGSTFQLTRSNASQSNETCVGAVQERALLKQIPNYFQTEPVASPAESVLQCDTSSQTSPDFRHSSAQTDHEPRFFQPLVLEPKDKQHELEKEIDELKRSLQMKEAATREEQRRYEGNVRTLMKKVKEHIRGRKAAEKLLEEYRRKACLPDGASGVRPESVLGQLDKLTKENQETGDEIRLAVEEPINLIQGQPGTPMVVEDSATFWKATHDGNEMRKRIRDLEDKIVQHQITIQELCKEISSEKRENSQLRSTMDSLATSLDTANDVLDNKKIDLGRSEAMSEILRNSIFRLQRDLDEEQVNHENCKQVCERIRNEVQEARASDTEHGGQTMILSDRDLEMHDDEGQEAAEDALVTLRCELETAIADKMALQTQVTELRTATQSTLQQNRLLRLRVEALSKPASAESSSPVLAPALASALPAAPTKYNESQIAQLLHEKQVYQLPWNQPLSNLQSCLDSLKTEMTSLQEQLIAKTSPRGQGGVEENQ